MAAMTTHVIRSTSPGQSWLFRLIVSTSLVAVSLNSALAQTTARFVIAGDSKGPAAYSPTPIPIVGGTQIRVISPSDSIQSSADADQRATLGSNATPSGAPRHADLFARLFTVA